jgi:hypothetical protein
MFLLMSTWLAISIWLAEYGWWIAAALVCSAQPRWAWRQATITTAGAVAAVRTRAPAR